MSNNPLIQQVLEKYKPIWGLDHASSLLNWDLEVYMPTKGSKPRGFALAQLALMRQGHLVQEAGLISQAEKLTGLNDQEKGILRVVKKAVDYYSKIPPKLLEDLERTGKEATVVWRDARQKSDFSTFKPWFEKIVDLKRQEAEKLGYEGHPYNALLNKYEEELTVADVDRVFSKLVPELKRILSKVLSEGKFPLKHPLEQIRYDETAMRRVNTEVLSILGMPDKTFRMDISTHPFTSGIAIEDVRVTTRYEGTDFKETLYSVIHECGHAMYALQIDPAYEYTPLADITSLALHESQSRFWENVVGRCRAFTKLIYPILKKNLPFVSGYSEDDVYRYFNMVRPSPIRVAADELTYNFHIILRYELEKKLVGGEVSVSELPSLWKSKMEEYVGVKPEDDAHGVLQDIHWSSGDIGYFPTYSLGNVISGMIFQQIQKDMELADVVARGELKEIKAWLREHIHKLGSTYSPKELQKRLFGEAYDPQAFVKYLEGKYLAAQ
jgi:carboxypeptidase Taq